MPANCSSVVDSTLLETFQDKPILILLGSLLFFVGMLIGFFASQSRRTGGLLASRFQVKPTTLGLSLGNSYRTSIDMDDIPTPRQPRSEANDKVNELPPVSSLPHTGVRPSARFEQEDLETARQQYQESTPRRGRRKPANSWVLSANLSSVFGIRNSTRSFATVEGAPQQPSDHLQPIPSIKFPQKTSP